MAAGTCMAKGACMAGGMHDGGVHGRGHAWQRVCMVGGGGACMAGDMHGSGACMVDNTRYSQ